MNVFVLYVYKESTPDESENVESLDKNDDIEEMEDDEKNVNKLKFYPF